MRVYFYIKAKVLFSNTLLRSLLLTVVFGICLNTKNVLGDEIGSNENQLKAAIVYNISRYVSWPLTAGKTSGDLVIGIVNDSYSYSVWKSLNGKPVQGRKIAVQRIVDIDDAVNCNIIVIENADNRRVQRIVSAVKYSPVLTISNAEDFIHHGGMISLRTLNNRLKFEVNLKNVRAAGLSMSSNLLKLAIDVIQ